MAKELYNNRLEWCTFACKNTAIGKAYREDLLKYYLEFFLIDLRIDELFGNTCTADDIKKSFELHHDELVHFQTKFANSIPFLPVIQPELWTPEIILKVMTFLEYKGVCCDPIIYKEIINKELRTRESNYTIDSTIYFLTDVCPLGGKRFMPNDFEIKESASYEIVHLLSLPEVLLLLLMHPKLIGESRYITGGTGKSSVGYPFIYFEDYRNSNYVFECSKLFSLDGYSVLASIPTAYGFVYGDEE